MNNDNNDKPLTHEELLAETIALIQRMNQQQINETINKALEIKK